MIAAQIKNEAFTAFLNGKSLRQIAAQPDMPSKRTLELWCKQEGWVTERAAARIEARKRAVEHHLPSLTAQCASVESSKHRIAMSAVAQLVALVEGDLTENQLSMSQVKLAKLINQLTKGK